MPLNTRGFCMDVASGDIQLSGDEGFYDGNTTTVSSFEFQIFSPRMNADKR